MTGEERRAIRAAAIARLRACKAAGIRPPKITTLVIDVAPGREQWCNDCLTGSRVVGDLLRITDQGVSKIGTYSACPRCDRGLAAE